MWFCYKPCVCKAFLLGLFRSGDAKLPSHILDLRLSLLSNLVNADIALQSVLAWAKWHVLTKTLIHNLCISITANLLSSAKAKKWTNIFRLQFSSTLFVLGIDHTWLLWKHSNPLFMASAAVLDHCNTALGINQEYPQRKGRHFFLSWPPLAHLHLSRFLSGI